MRDDREDYAALRGAAAYRRVERDFLSVTGAEAAAYLQGQLSQDVEALDVGSSADTLLLSPQGKIDALARVTRTGQEAFVVDTEGGFGEGLLARLARFKLRVKAELEPLDWSCIAVRGPEAAKEEAADAECLVLPASWPGLDGVDIAGVDPAPPPWAHACGIAAWEAARIEAGVPRMGTELDSRTIPAEAWLNDRAVSFTKGCYTGQELVARLEARGNKVPRRLRGVVVEGTEVPAPGAALLVGDKAVGTVTSAAASPGPLGVVALAYVGRQVEPPEDVELEWGGRRGRGRVQALPLVP